MIEWEFYRAYQTLNAGEFFYIYGNSDTEAILEGFGIGDTDVNAILGSIANLNGDDIFALSTSSDPLDTFDAFGLLGQGDTDFGQDSIGHRIDATPNATGVLDAGNFSFESYNEQALLNTFGSFVIPEPSITALLSLGVFTFIRRKRD